MEVNDIQFSSQVGVDGEKPIATIGDGNRAEIHVEEALDMVQWW